MRFGEMFEFMMQGKKVRRGYMPSNQYIIYDSRFESKFISVGPSETFLETTTRYVFSTDDVLAEDWEIVNRPRPTLITNETERCFINTLKSKLDAKFPHIKLEDIDYDLDTQKIKVCFVHTPRGVYIQENIQENIDLQVQDIVNSANQAIKKMVFEDMIKWCLDEREPLNMNGVDVVLDPTVPNDIIIMNHSTFLDFRRYRPPL